MGVLETKRVIQPPKRRRMNKRMRAIQSMLRIFVLVIGVAVIGILIYILGFARYVSIDLADLTNVELSGYDGKGTLEPSTKMVVGYEEFFDTVEVNMVENDEAVNGQLSNGDRVELEYTYDKSVAKALKLRVKTEEEYVIVKDLPAATVVTEDDIFEGILVSYEGIAPLVTVTMENNTVDEVLKTVEFEVVNPKEYYDNGDVFTVRAVCDPGVFFDAEYETADGATEYTRDYPISVPDRYITDASEISDELLEDMKAKGASLFGTESGDANEFGLRIFSDAGKMYTTENTKYTFRFTGTSYISAYFTHVNDEYAGQQGTHYNDVKIVYDTGISQSDGQSVAAEAVVIYRNIIKREDGTVDVDLDEGQIISVSRRDEQIKNLVRATDDDQYTSMKLEQ